jgi:regulator of CtrA degradation
MFKTTRIADDRGPVLFGEKLASSGSFKALFKEGMTLVEDAAAYLDGPGRNEAKLLLRGDALAYASESMRLTTRLMQLASWLLLRRAVNEGEISQSEAAAEKRRVKLSRQDLATNAEGFQRLPQRLQDLSVQSLRLQARIQHLDRILYPGSEPEPAAERPLGVEAQLNRLRAAFQPG